MTGICSKHQRHDPNCKACNTNIRDVLPNYDEKIKEAEAAGRHTCKKCKFVYYKTVPYCPLCNHIRET